MSADQATPTGVYYDRKDYLGITRRLLIDIIDIPFALALSALVVVAARALLDDAEGPGITLLLCGAVWFVYFVLLKRSRLRTVGYMVLRAQIVDLKGQQPSILSMLARLFFAFVGPLNALVDLFWITGDANGQAIRDKFSADVEFQAISRLSNLKLFEGHDVAQQGEKADEG